MSWRDWFKRKPSSPSREAQEAHREADASLHRARMDLEESLPKTLESRMIAIRLREHNTANHYDDWLSEQFLKYYTKD